MRHRRDGRKLGITAEHRKAMLANMVGSLFKHERIETTTPKAKEARRLAEKLITHARRGDLASRRHVARTIQDVAILQKLFAEIAPRYVDRPGGYTRIIRLGTVRVGDGGSKSILELLKKDEEGRTKKKTSRKTYHKLDMPAAIAAKEKPAPAADAVPEGAADAAAAEAAAPAEGAAQSEAPKAEAAHAAKPKAHKAEGEKKAKAKPADKPKGKK
jgi:large subunit ribosomal protein L17